MSKRESFEEKQRRIRREVAEAAIRVGRLVMDPSGCTFTHRSMDETRDIFVEGRAEFDWSPKAR